MFELADDLLPLLRDGTAVAAVTVTRVTRSAPRGAGATIAVTAEGRVLGSISGGCVEGDAIVLAHGARVGGIPLVARLGFSDDAAHAAGLACGGSVEVAAYAIRPGPRVISALEAAAAGIGVSVGIVLEGPDAGRVLDEHQLREHLSTTDDLLSHRETAVVPGAADGRDLLVVSHAPRPRLIIAGAGEHAAALCRVAAAAGFAVTVCDVWETLVTRERFPAADERVVGLPHEHLAAIDPAALDARTAVCVLTHDERLDVPALAAALSLPVGFVGAMGARGTVVHRAELLREAGVAERDIARIRSPLGLDLGGASPDETALSVLAEIVAARHGGSGLPLRERTGALHHRPAGPASPVSDTAEPAGHDEPASASPRRTREAVSRPAAPAATAAVGCGIPHPAGAS